MHVLERKNCTSGLTLLSVAFDLRYYCGWKNPIGTKSNKGAVKHIKLHDMNDINVFNKFLDIYEHLLVPD